MLARIAAFVIWASVGAGIAFWVLRMSGSALRVPAHTVQVSTANAYQGDLARLFGSDAPPQLAAQRASMPVPADSRFRLVGVVAPKVATKAAGLAVIALDDKPAKAFSVGASVDGDLVLLSVHARGAALGLPGEEPRLNLELPPLAPPATGKLPAAAAVPPSSRPTLPSRPLPPRAPAPAERMPADAPPGEPAVPPAVQQGEPQDDPSGRPVLPPAGPRDRSPV